MNILCISKYASPPKYGVAARLFYLAKEIVISGHNVTLMTSDSNHLAVFPETNKHYVRENIDGVDVVWFKNRKYRKTASVDRILSWFSFEISLFRFPKAKLKKPDVVIVSSLSLLSVLYGYYLKRYFRVPLVFEVRDIWPLTLVVEGGFARYHPLTLFLGVIEKFGYRKADLIVGTMPRLDLHVRKILGYDKPFFCSPLGFAPKVMAARNQICIGELKKYFPKDRVIVGYAGSMGISNNLDGLVETISELKGDQKLHFVLVGSGDLRGKYEEVLQGFDNVTFVPRISPDMVPVFLKQCDILYLSTHDSEVWKYGQSMNKVVEYMYAGKPIVATYSGYPSMIDESGCGVFVKENNMQGLVDQLEILSDMGSEGRVAMGSKGNAWILKNRNYGELAKQYLDRLSSISGLTK